MPEGATGRHSQEGVTGALARPAFTDPRDSGSDGSAASRQARVGLARDMYIMPVTRNTICDRLLARASNVQSFKFPGV